MLARDQMPTQRRLSAPGHGAEGGGGRSIAGKRPSDRIASKWYQLR
jgi:hypothetical protein